MSKGRRYSGERKLNMKKVAAVIIAIIVIIMFIIGMKQIFKADKSTIARKNVELNYFTLLSNGNWGVINSYGDVVIEPSNSEMVVIPNKSKPVFICTYEVNYVDGSYKTKAINENNQQIFTEYDNVMAIQNYDENNNLWFEQNLLKVQKDGKFGLINLDGNQVLGCEYDSITPLKGISNSIVIKKDNQVGLVDSNGKTVIPVGYTDITALTKDYTNGYIVKNQESKFGVVKSDGRATLECKYNEIKNIADTNKYIVKEDSTWKVVAEDGTTYLEGKVDNAVDMVNGNIILNNNGKYGVINIEGTQIVPAEYEELAMLFDDKFIAKKEGKYGVINSSAGTVVEFKYSEIKYNKQTDYIKAKNEDGTYDYMTRDLSVKLTAGEETVLDGFISIKNQNDVKYYNYKLEEKSNKDVYTANTLFITKQNGKYGFIDKDGNTVIDAIYDDAIEQNDCGYVAVKKDGKWGAIDQEGKVVIEPTYSLDNNKVIDFIGKWHVSADSNANYYTDAE